jgi:DNA-directed RNA polymerase specialized sigma24 family protein
MDHEDIAQELFLDLWRRRMAYDPDRASFTTFTDRIVAHRAATLVVPTARERFERHLVSLDGIGNDDDGQGLAGVLPDPASPGEDDLAAAIDVRRFAASLSPALRRCCDLLVEPNRQAAAIEAGLHRSTIYETARRLRLLAERAGLKDYIGRPRQIRRTAGKCRS